MPKISQEQMVAIMQEHARAALETPAEEIYKIPAEHWQRISSTFIENWPDELFPLCKGSLYGFALSNKETRALGSCMGELGGGFKIDDLAEGELETIVEGIKQRIEESLSRCGHRAFVRLGSRSPKDCWIPPSAGDIHKGLVTTPNEVLRRLCSDSERIYEDLQTSLAMRYDSYIWLREWLEIEPWQEFRCFMRNRELIGISQYDYYAGRFDEVVEHAAEIDAAIREFFELFREVSHLDSVIFDVIVKEEEGRFRAEMLEINPFCWTTDPCLYTWDVLDTLPPGKVGGLRFSTEKKEPRPELTQDPDELIGDPDQLTIS